MADTVYVDEDVGRDEESVAGSETAPYKTLLFAMIQHPKATYQTRKSETGPVDANGDPSARLGMETGNKISTQEGHQLV